MCVQKRFHLKRSYFFSFKPLSFTGDPLEGLDGHDGGYHQAYPRPRCLLSPTWLCFPGGPICALVPKPAAQLRLQPTGLLRSRASASASGPSSPGGPGLEYGVGVGPEDSVQAHLFISAPDVLCHLEGQCRPQPLGKDRVRDTWDMPGARLPPRPVASPTPQRLSAPSLSPPAQAQFIRLSTVALLKLQGNKNQ